jgi:hypothetical protein
MTAAHVRSLYIRYRVQGKRIEEHTKGRMEQMCIGNDAIGLLEQETTVLKGESVLEDRTKNCEVHILKKMYPSSNK